jgi:hypothetical protein
MGHEGYRFYIVDGSKEAVPSKLHYTVNMKEFLENTTIEEVGQNPPNGPNSTIGSIGQNLPMPHIGVNLYKKEYELYELKCILRYKLNDPNNSIESIESLRLEIDTLEKELDEIIPDRATKNLPIDPYKWNMPDAYVKKSQILNDAIYKK